MAYINAEITHSQHDISIQVLEPTKDEFSYSEGIQVDVNWDEMSALTLSDFKEVVQWMLEKAAYIEENFTKNGKPKKIIIKG